MSLITSSEEYYRNFKNAIRSHDTFLSYDNKLKAFMRHCGVTPQDYASLIEGKDAKTIEADIIEFIVSLKDNHYALGSQKSYLNALMLFYSINDVAIRRKKISRFMSNDDSVTEDGNDNNSGSGSGEKPYSRDQIAKMLEFADLRTRVMILLMCSAGLRVGGLSSVINENSKGKYLKFGDLIPIEDHQIYQITVYAYSKSSRYHTFCTPECRKAIDNYLNFRRQCGENITAKSPVLRREFDRDDIFASANIVKPLTRFGIKKVLTKLVYASGIRIPMIDNKNRLTARRDTMLTHGFRKFFDTTCTNAGMNTIYIEWCMGHRLPGVKGDYFKPMSDSNGVYRDLLEGHDKSPGYLDSIEWLTINNENRLKQQVETLIVSKSQYEALKEELVKFQQTRDKMNKFMMYCTKDDINKISKRN